MTENSRSHLYSKAHRTKTDIARALNECCSESDFTSITVEDVASKAGISRSGFYYHFSDLNKVVTWITAYSYEKGIDLIGRSLTWLQGNLITTTILNDYRALLNKASRIIDYDGGVPYFTRHRRQILKETLAEYKHMELTKTLSFQIEALPYIEQSMSNNFRTGHYDLSIQEFCQLLTSCVPKELFDALNEPTLPAPSGIDALNFLL